MRAADKQDTASGELLNDPSRLLDYFYPRLYALLLRLSGNQHDAEDLAQTTLVRAWKSRASFRGDSNVATWLHRIGYRTYLDWLKGRENTARKETSWWKTCTDGSASPFDSAADADLAAFLYGQVEELDEGVRQVIHLRYYQDMPVRDVAVVMRIAPRTVKHRVKLALSKLRAALEQATPRQPRTEL
jgi:RNA polymerase sigma-70 factor (ECF subfamily)